MKPSRFTTIALSLAVVAFTFLTFAVEAATARLVEFKVMPHQVVGGNQVTLMLTFDRPGFAKPILISGDPTVVPVPGTINKADHQVSLTQRVTTRAVNGPKTVQIKAIWGNVTRTQNLVVNPERPGAFDLRAPANNATNGDGRPLFQWNAAARAGTYTLCIVRDDQQLACRNAAGVARMFDGITQTERRPGDLSEFNNRRVIWFVRACNVTGCTNGGPARFLRIQIANTQPPPPTGPSFQSTLERTFRHERCVNCHGFFDNDIKNQLTVGVNHSGMTTATDCASCHTEAIVGTGATGAFRWHAPQGLSLQITSTRDLCELRAKRGAGGRNPQQHMTQDPLIRWAVAGGQVPMGRPNKPTAPPNNANTWNQRVNSWWNNGNPACP